MTIEAITASIHGFCRHEQPSLDQIYFAIRIIQILQDETEKYKSPVSTKQALSTVYTELFNIYTS